MVGTAVFPEGYSGDFGQARHARRFGMVSSGAARGSNGVRLDILVFVPVPGAGVTNAKMSSLTPMPCEACG